MPYQGMVRLPNAEFARHHRDACCLKDQCCMRPMLPVSLQQVRGLTITAACFGTAGALSPAATARRLDNVLKHAPHTADVVMADEWARPYARERAAFPAAWVRQAKFWPTTSRVDNVFGDRKLVARLPEGGHARRGSGRVSRRGPASWCGGVCVGRRLAKPW